MSKISQTDIVLNHMKIWGFITTMDAFKMGITRLSQHILLIRKDQVVYDTWIHPERGNKYKKYSLFPFDMYGDPIIKK